MPDHVFTVTTFAFDKEPLNVGVNKEMTPVIRSRTVGVFSSQQEAEDVLIENLGDLNEAGYYPYAVVEKIKTGLYPNPEQMSVWRFMNVNWLQCVAHPDPVKRYLQTVTGFGSIG